MENRDKDLLGIIDAKGEVGQDYEVKISDPLPPGVEKFNHEDGILLVSVKYDHERVDWALLQKVTYGNTESETIYQIYVYGSGIASNLREPRHTYFGEEGYIFYVKPELINWAFGILKKWFDY